MDILTEHKNGLLTIQINRPARKNAFTNAMYSELAKAFGEAALRKNVKAVLFKGHSDCFSAGNDLGDFTANPPQSLDAPVFNMMRNLHACPKPIVAQVQGVAVGIGTTLLLHCDLVYAADNAKFSVPFTKLGLCAEFASSLLMTQNAGYQRAAEMLLLGDLFTAEQAKAAGFVSDVLPADQLQAHVDKQVAKLMALPASALMTTKSLMKSHLRNPISDKIREEGQLFIHMLRQPVAQEAFSAFAEKRAPNFAQFESRTLG